MHSNVKLCLFNLNKEIKISEATRQSGSLDFTFFYSARMQRRSLHRHFVSAKVTHLFDVAKFSEKFRAKNLITWRNQESTALDLEKQSKGPHRDS